MKTDQVIRVYNRGNIIMIHNKNNNNNQGVFLELLFAAKKKRKSIATDKLSSFHICGLTVPSIGQEGGLSMLARQANQLSTRHSPPNLTTI